MNFLTLRGLLDGLEAEVSLVVDSVYPSDQLPAALNDFHTKFPTVPLRISVQALEGVERVVRNGNAWIGVGQRIEIGAVRLIPVAAPNHPLALSGATSSSRGRQYLQLVLSNQPAAEGRVYCVVSLANWRVGDLTIKHKLLVGGIGWGGMPEPMVRADIESGRLVRLDLRDWRSGEYAMQVVHKTETPPGPAGRWLIERLVLSPPPVRVRRSNARVWYPAGQKPVSFRAVKEAKAAYPVSKRLES
jgi:DNA-binding transcriptional LysR family regulator